METQILSLKSVDMKKLIVQLQYREIHKLISDISDLFPYVIIKGIPLSFMAYNDCFKRRIGDVDFLIAKEDISAFDSILKRNKFVCEYSSREDKLIAMLYSHQTRPYVKETPICKTYIDVNYDVFWGEYSGKKIDIKNFISQPVKINIMGYSINTLSPIKMLIVLVLHHYKEMNSLYHLVIHNTIRKEMFFDVYSIINRNSDSIINVETLACICDYYEIKPYAYYILYYTYQLFPNDMLKKIVESLYCEEGKSLLPCYGLNEKERKEWQCDFCTRINATDIKSLIANQLTDEDLNKIERNKLIFGDQL